MKVHVTLVLAASLLLGVVSGASAAAAPRPPAEGLAWVGETVQGLPISFVLTKDRKKIKRLDVEWFALPGQCSSGLPYGSRTTFGAGQTKALPITRKSFGHTFLDAFEIPGVIAMEETPVIGGTVGRTRAFGAFSAIAVMKDGAGTEITRCDTGPIAWTAIQ
jgi:hypothetical protein